MNRFLEAQYKSYASSRLKGNFQELGSWDLVLPSLRDKKTLDIGCSNGLYLRHLSKDSIGIEQIEELAVEARAQGLNIIHADVLDGLKSQQGKSYDGVLFSHVLEHLECPLDALREINRVLVNGGTLLLGLPLEKSIYRQILNMDYFGGTHIFSFSVKNCNVLLDITGFKFGKVYYDLPYFRGPFGYFLNNAWNILPFPWKEWLSMSYWIIATKHSEPKI